MKFGDISVVTKDLIEKRLKDKTHFSNKLGEQLRELAVLLGRELADTMFEFTAEEWVNTNISPKIREIDELVASVDVGLAKHEQKFVLIPLSREVGKTHSTDSVGEPD